MIDRLTVCECHFQTQYQAKSPISIKQKAGMNKDEMEGKKAS